MPSPCSTVRAAAFLAHPAGVSETDHEPARRPGRPTEGPRAWTGSKRSTSRVLGADQRALAAGSTAKHDLLVVPAARTSMATTASGSPPGIDMPREDWLRFRRALRRPARAGRPRGDRARCPGPRPGDQCCAIDPAGAARSSCASAAHAGRIAPVPGRVLGPHPAVLRADAARAQARDDPRADQLRLEHPRRVPARRAERRADARTRPRLAAAALVEAAALRPGGQGLLLDPGHAAAHDHASVPHGPQRPGVARLQRPARRAHLRRVRRPGAARGPGLRRLRLAVEGRSGAPGAQGVVRQGLRALGLDHRHGPLHRRRRPGDRPHRAGPDHSRAGHLGARSSCCSCSCFSRASASSAAARRSWRASASRRRAITRWSRRPPKGTLLVLGWPLPVRQPHVPGHAGLYAAPAGVPGAARPPAARAGTTRCGEPGGRPWSAEPLGEAREGCLTRP